MPEQTLGQAIRADRHQAQITQRDLADAAGCHYSHISKIENDHLIPSAALLQKIAAHLYTSPARYLQLAGKEDPVMLRRWVDYLLKKVTRLQSDNAYLKKLITKHGIRYRRQ